MTVQEAINELKDWKQAINTLGEYKDKDVSSTLEALDMAIEALQEQDDNPCENCQEFDCYGCEYKR